MMGDSAESERTIVDELVVKLSLDTADLEKMIMVIKDFRDVYIAEVDMSRRIVDARIRCLAEQLAGFVLGTVERREDAP